MEIQQLPQFYRKPVILNSDSHASLTIGPSPSGFSFAATAQTCLLASAEFFDAGRQMPIMFSTTQEGRFVAVCLMGLEQNENLFVGQDGGWRADYIPAYIRRYPFITTDGLDGKLAVCFEESFDGFNCEGGAPLFEDGKPTIKLMEIQSFMQDYFLQLRQTEQMVTALATAGLFRQVELHANLPDGRNFNMNDLLIVDEQRLTQLPDIDIVKLFRTGTLAQIHAHLLSLRNLSSLIELKTAAGLE